MIIQTKTFPLEVSHHPYILEVKDTNNDEHYIVGNSVAQCFEACILVQVKYRVELDPTRTYWRRTEVELGNTQVYERVGK